MLKIHSKRVVQWLRVPQRTFQLTALKVPCYGFLKMTFHAVFKTALSEWKHLEKFSIWKCTTYKVVVPHSRTIREYRSKSSWVICEWNGPSWKLGLDSQMLRTKSDLIVNNAYVNEFQSFVNRALLPRSFTISIIPPMNYSAVEYSGLLSQVWLQYIA